LEGKLRFTVSGKFEILGSNFFSGEFGIGIAFNGTFGTRSGRIL